jgi:hypothetical protein
LFFKIVAEDNVALFLRNQIDLIILMKEKKKIKGEEKVKELVAKNQEVIDALKRLRNNISNDQSILNSNTAFEKSESLNIELKDQESL